MESHWSGPRSYREIEISLKFNYVLSVSPIVLLFTGYGSAASLFPPACQAYAPALVVPMITMTRKKGKTTHNVMTSKKIPIKLNAVRRRKEFMWCSVEIMFSFFSAGDAAAWGDVYPQPRSTALSASLFRKLFFHHEFRPSETAIFLINASRAVYWTLVQ